MAEQDLLRRMFFSKLSLATFRRKNESVEITFTEVGVSV
jgi:hypothetical protein